jgi:hypothetical protein
MAITELPEHSQCKPEFPCAYLHSGGLAKTRVSHTGIRVAELPEVNVLFEPNKCSVG